MTKRVSFSGGKSNAPPENERSAVHCDVASPARFELTTFRLGGGRSILLSYGDMMVCLGAFFCGGPSMHAARAGPADRGMRRL